MAEEKLMTEKEWKEKQTRKTRKKHIRNALALILVAVISVVGTLAYLSKKTGPTTNTFTGSTGLELGLTEPNWDKDKAEGYIPNQIIYKDPQLYNGSKWEYTGSGTSPNIAIEDKDVTSAEKYTEYVAMQIDFKDNNGTLITYGNLLNVIKPISFNTTNWALVKVSTDGSTWTDALNTDLENTPTDTAKNAKRMIFLYKGSNLTELNPKKHTTALFSQIQIKEGTKDDSIKTLNGDFSDGTKSDDGTTLIGGFPDFKIIVKGAAVDTGSYGDTTNHLVTEAETDLINLLKSN